jgi:hypothetical protein
MLSVAFKCYAGCCDFFKTKLRCGLLSSAKYCQCFLLIV